MTSPGTACEGGWAEYEGEGQGESGGDAGTGDSN